MKNEIDIIEKINMSVGSFRRNKARLVAKGYAQ